MSAPDRDLILFDVDNTIGCGFGGSGGKCCEPRPGAKLLFAALYVLGYELRLWSAGGAEHARLTAEQGGFTDVMSGYHTKPDYPIHPTDVVKMFGRLPVLTFDDDETEKIDGVPLIPVAPYLGEHLSSTGLFVPNSQLDRAASEPSRGER